MGNLQCPAEDAAHLAGVARTICPFPNYNPNPLFIKMLSSNSSRHLQEHYAAVQSSLTPKQLEDFTQTLKTTFGREGNVTSGGFGVVALSLAVLFDTLSRQVRGQVVSDSGPIPGLFVKDPGSYYPPQVYTISKYLRLVPHIANNPTKMKEATERSIKQLAADEDSLKRLERNHSLPLTEDVTSINMMLGKTFEAFLKVQLMIIKNSTAEELEKSDGEPPDNYTLNFNCDTEVADKVFLAEVKNSDDYTREAFNKCKPEDDAEPKSLLRYIAELEIKDTMSIIAFSASFSILDKISKPIQREDFNLKTQALGKWS